MKGYDYETGHTFQVPDEPGCIFALIIVVVTIIMILKSNGAI